MSEWEGDCSLLETLTEDVSIQLQTDTQMVDCTHMTEISPKKAENSVNSSRALSEDGEQEYEIETTCECEPRFQEQLSEQAREIAHWKEKYTGLLGSLDGVLSAMEDIQRKYAETQKAFGQEKEMMLQEIANLKSENEQFEEKLSKWKDGESEKSEEITKRDATISSLKAELAEMKSNLSQGKKDLESERSQVASLKSQVEKLSKQKEPQPPAAAYSTPSSKVAVLEGPLSTKTLEVSESSTTEQSSLGSVASQNSQQYWRRVNTQQEPGENGAKARNNRMRNLSSNIFTLDEKEPVLETPIKKPAIVTVEDVQGKPLSTPRTPVPPSRPTPEDQPIGSTRSRCNRRNPQADFSPVPTLEDQIASARAKSPMKIDSPNDVPGIEAVMSRVTGEREVLVDKLKQLEAIRPRTGDILKQKGKLNEEIDVVNSQLDSLKSKIRRIYSHK